MQLPSCAKPLHKFDMCFITFFHFLIYHVGLLVFFIKKDNDASKIVGWKELDTQVSCDPDDKDAPAQMVLEVTLLRQVMSSFLMDADGTIAIADGNAKWDMIEPEEPVDNIDVSCIPVLFVAG